jgi:protein-S-isoprenylcysteine O-methyltransferase Ste14
LAYVIGVGTMLRRQDHSRWFTDRYGVEGGYLRFRRIASTIMNLDAVLFVVVCILSRGTLGTPWPVALRISIGLVAIVVGAGIKLWARHALGPEAYYWRNFFSPEDHRVGTPSGPYKYLDNPMYTIGYLQTFGLALAFDSAPALVLAAFMQIAVLIFYRVVERPHFVEISKKGQPPDEADETNMTTKQARKTL